MPASEIRQGSADDWWRLGKDRSRFLKTQTWTTHEMVDSVFHLHLTIWCSWLFSQDAGAWLAVQVFAWEAVPAHVVGLTGQIVDGKTLKHDDAVFPCAGSLCQGFSWSLYFAQRANEFLCQSISPLAEAQLSNDRGGPIVMKIGKHAGLNHTSTSMLTIWDWLAQIAKMLRLRWMVCRIASTPWGFNCMPRRSVTAMWRLWGVC